jgi:hypothetical protein
MDPPEEMVSIAISTFQEGELQASEAPRIIKHAPSF